MRSKNTMLLTGLLCTVLAACHSTDGTSLTRSSSGDNAYNTTAGASTQSSMPGSNTSNTGSTATTTSTASDMSTGSDASQSGMNITAATVQTIETVPRSMDQGSGDMQTGTSGTGGTGGAALNNMLYRVTLRLDDGSTRTLMQTTQPGFQIGDRVSVQRGAIQRY
ncbi:MULTISPECIES: hypothetical protein [unclassified Janthinobacterium]|uniref:hypothetical protein n=1 Tax=unclassified Janthinobacterium TaxID=2610881 RepID=UPI00160BE61F|nr:MULTISPECIES: hypothetical protein [unclassified Janthinobacterium]MBB5369496.1 hypothetical protein [Janthinobacterium sp. K2C7]MBB5382548.1 hypothetical protein [Janthinobacterium sp. K2Li3]MBB5388125.1 hypothetical protein [Janthinobacterium sp. K2E3]